MSGPVIEISPGESKINLIFMWRGVCSSTS